MAWYDSVVGGVSKAVTKHVIPAVADYGGAVVGGAVGTVVGGPAGTVAGAAAGSAATKAIKGAVKGASKPRRKPAARAPAPRPPQRRPRPSKRSQGRRVQNVRKVAIVFTVDGDGKVRRKAMKLPASIARQVRKAVRRAPTMVVPSGSQKGDALAAAGRLIASVQSADPKLAAYAKSVMNNTALRARAGDPAARRAVSFLKAAQSANKSKGRLTGFLVTNSGRVVIGSFIQTG